MDVSRPGCPLGSGFCTLVGVLAWGSRIQRDSKNENVFFFYAVEYWPPVQAAKIPPPHQMMCSEELWCLHLMQEQDSDEALGEMDRPVFPPGVGLHDTPKERGEILSWGQATKHRSN